MRILLSTVDEKKGIQKNDSRRRPQVIVDWLKESEEEEEEEEEEEKTKRGVGRGWKETWSK